MDFILGCLPVELSRMILEHNAEKLEEIRIRAGRPVILKLGVMEIILKYVVTNAEIIGIVQSMCCNSVYAYQNQICCGYITLPGGNRAGISGNVVVKDGKVSNISYIYSINIRVSHQIKGASDEVIRYILDTKNNTVYNSLIVSPPGVRKNYNYKGYCKKS